MSAGGTGSQVLLGPGRLWVAPIGTAEPTSASASLDAAFVAVGYTEQGTAFTSELTTEEVLVAEELEPVKFVNTRHTRSVQFEMAEATLRNLRLAMNEGVQTPSGGDTWEPEGDPDNLVRVMIVHDSAETAAGNADNRRWLFRQCFNVAPVEIARRKAPTKTLVPARFSLEKPDDAEALKVWSDQNALI